MDLLKYLEPMKHLPDRFSNLAFWRGCRKFKDAVVNAFEYVDSWGESIENTELSLTSRITSLESKVGYPVLKTNFAEFEVTTTLKCDVQQLGEHLIILATNPINYTVDLSDTINLNTNNIGFAYLYVDVTYSTATGGVSTGVRIPVTLSKNKYFNTSCEINMPSSIGGIYSQSAINVAPTTTGHMTLRIQTIAS